MKQLVKIWALVFVLAMGGALPPQVTGDNEVTTQWCAQAKNKNKKKKNKKNKKKSSKSNKTSKYSKSSLASPLVSVPIIGKTATAAVPQQSANALLGVGIPKGQLRGLRAHGDDGIDGRCSRA